MLRTKLIKTLLFILLGFVISSNCAFAKTKYTADVVFKPNSMQFVTADTIKNATFKRFNDLWIIFSVKDLQLNINKQDLIKFGIMSFEKLITKNGTGFRMRFKNNVPAINFLHDYDKRTTAINLTSSELRNKKRDTIKFRVNNINNEHTLKRLFLDSTFMLDYAYSLQTGEKYVVAISNDSRFRYPTKQVSQGLYFLPTYSGAVIISEKGEFLRIHDEEVLKLADNEDKFFAQAAESFNINKLDYFFYNTGISLIERQVRDYSKFNRNVADFKPSKDYKQTLKQLNNALDLIEQMNYLEDSKSLNPITKKRLENIRLEEDNVVDLSAEDDGLFEIEKQVKKELKDELTVENNEILVPDFSSGNLSFLMERLRLASIRQVGSFQKEKITLKRMQISAYKKYYNEILDLTKMTRLDISGEYPKNNKGLALYALANAQIGRCKEIIQLPEKEGSVYTKDLRLWKAFCMEKQQKYNQALTLFKRDEKRIATYPKHLQEDLRISYASVLKNTDNFKGSIAILKQLEKNANGKTLEKIKLLLGENYLYQNESKLAEKEFKDLLFAQNIPVKYKARLEYLNILLQTKETNVDKETIIGALEELRFDFRSNNTELEASKTLASLYLQEDYLKQAMELYKYISIYFPKSSSAKQATAILFNIFYNLFSNNQQLNSHMDNIDRLALFYDFIELTPSDHQGNNVISNVVADLIDLGLYNKAIDLLTIQLNYKTKDEDIAQELGEKLAELYMQTGQLKNAEKTLELTQKNHNIENYTTKAYLIIAHILMQQNKIKQAEKYLYKIKDNLQAKYALSEIYWRENNYQEIIKTLENIFLGKRVELDEQGMVNLSYLMLSYSLTNNVEKLQQVKDLYLSELKKVDLEHKLEFLMKLAGADVKIEKQDNKLLDIWQDVVRIDNNVLDFVNEYNQEAEFRKAMIDRDFKTLEKYKDKLN